MLKNLKGTREDHQEEKGFELNRNKIYLELPGCSGILIRLVNFSFFSWILISEPAVSLALYLCDPSLLMYFSPSFSLDHSTVLMPR